MTRALISDTICTPLLFEAVEVTPLAVLEARLVVLRLTAGRGTGVRGACRRLEGLVMRPGCVAERAREGVLLDGVDTPVLGGRKPARCSIDGGVAE